MSTSYFLLREPVTSLRVEPRGSHADISVWVNHGKAGVLTVRDEEIQAFLHLFADRDLPPILRTTWGGKDVGTVVHEEQDKMEPSPDEVLLISEYGELLTAGQVRARAGAKRADGMPTELFGYEEGKA